jgi:hypothetical protein
MRSPGVKAVVALEPYVVRVVFANGEVRDVDIEPILDGPIFRALRGRRRGSGRLHGPLGACPR